MNTLLVFMIADLRYSQPSDSDAHSRARSRRPTNHLVPCSTAIREQPRGGSEHPDPPLARAGVIRLFRTSAIIRRARAPSTGQYGRWCPRDERVALCLRSGSRARVERRGTDRRPRAGTRETRLPASVSCRPGRHGREAPAACNSPSPTRSMRYRDRRPASCRRRLPGARLPAPGLISLRGAPRSPRGWPDQAGWGSGAGSRRPSMR